MNTSYREMLRDRLPKMVDLALRFCKAKEAWLTHVYKNFIWIYSSKEERYKATRKVLGLDEGRGFVFHDTIDWDNVTIEERDLWTSVERVVKWFQTKHLYAKNSYRIQLSKGKNWATLKYELMRDFLQEFCPTTEDSPEEKQKKNKFVNKFADFVMDTF